MVVGKLLILFASTSVQAEDIQNPNFTVYRSGGLVNQIVDFTFGWFRKLDDDQKAAYDSALTHAVMFAENGERVTWYKNEASGYAIPVMTWPKSSGYCRRMHIQAIAHGVEKTMSATACFDDITSRWKWHNDKY